MALPGTLHPEKQIDDRRSTIDDRAKPLVVLAVSCVGEVADRPRRGPTTNVFAFIHFDECLCFVGRRGWRTRVAVRPHNNGVEAPWATKSLKDLAAKGKASAAVKEGGKDGRIAELEAKVSELTTSVVLLKEQLARAQRSGCAADECCRGRPLAAVSGNAQAQAEAQPACAPAKRSRRLRAWSDQTLQPAYCVRYRCSVQ